MSEHYGEYYFQHCCGRPYERTPEWLLFFAGIADRIVRDIGPRTVLDAGCAMGFLVEALRERSVEAYGIDISEYAIERVHPTVRPYCSVASVTDPLPRHYDLIVCIEVLEHLPPADAARAIEQFCAHSDDVLISTTPYDYEEPTHVNVRPPEDWAESFASEGFFRDLAFDASFITDWAVRFRRQEGPMAQLIGAYERRLARLEAENRSRRRFAVEMQNQLAANEQEAQKLKDEIELLSARATAAEGAAAPLRDRLDQMRQEVQSLQAELAARRDEAARTVGQIETLRQTLKEQDQEIGRLRLEAHLTAARAADLETKLQQGQDKVSVLGSLLETSESSVRQRDEVIAGLRNEIAGLRNEIAGLRNEIGSLQSEVTAAERYAEHYVEATESTAGWKVLTAARALRLRLIPEGSAAARLWRLGMSFIRVWIDEGLMEALFRAQAKLLSVVRPSRPPVDPVVQRSTGAATARSPSSLRRSREQGASLIEAALLRPHTGDATIVVCVHNALDDVKRCLASLVRFTRPPYTLVIIDDGSDPETAGHLARFAEAQGAVLIRNDESRGYTRAANQGLRARRSDYVVVLNSDTLVTPDWLDRMIACAESDPSIGLVGPLSNTASWQSIPEIFGPDGKDWAENALPGGVSARDMARLIARDSARLFPRIPFLNGFCLLIKQAVVDQIGVFDEERFGEGYGEENDYCLRAAAAGWQPAVADDTYIFHAQSRSYSHERRKRLAERAHRALVAEHGEQAVSERVYLCRHNRILEGVRARARILPHRQRLIDDGRERWEARRVAFLLMDIHPGGGGRVVFQEALPMRKMGADVEIVGLARNKSGLEQSYPEAKVPIRIVEDERWLGAELGRYDAVVATFYRTVSWLTPLRPNGQGPRRAYYVQDYEPAFFPEGSREFRLASRSYTLFPDLIRVTKTAWNQAVVKEQTGAECVIVGPSVDLDLFRPRPRVDGDWPHRPLRIAAMIRPGSPRRNAALTMEVLRRHHRAHGNTIEIVLFGCNPDDPDFIRLPRDFPFRLEGILSAPRLACLLNEVDIFVDFSKWQAMGMTALEAMACGVAVILPEKGGASTFARHEENALLTDTGSIEGCGGALETLTMDEDLRVHLQRAAISAACAFPPEQAALRLLDALLAGNSPQPH